MAFSAAFAAAPAKKRPKIFGQPRLAPLDREAKIRIRTLARALMRRIDKGKAYGVLTAKAVAVLEALLWKFHNNKDGRCFPGYEAIAEAAGCARSTVYEAIHALEAAGLLTWVNRLCRVRERVQDETGAVTMRTRVVRTSNAYQFRDTIPSKPELCKNSSKSEKPIGTPDPDLFSSSSSTKPAKFDPGNPLDVALLRIGRAIRAKKKPD